MCVLTTFQVIQRQAIRSQVWEISFSEQVLFYLIHFLHMVLFMPYPIPKRKGYGHPSLKYSGTSTIKHVTRSTLLLQ